MKESPPIAQIAMVLSEQRQKLGLSIAEVARRAKVAKSTLSQLENANGNPSIETLWSLCVVLELPISRLLESPRPQTKLIRRGEATTLASENKDYVASLLASCPDNVCRDIYWIDVRKDQVHHSAPHHQGTIEHIIITKGAAEIGVDGQCFKLNEGDYICYAADLPHSFEGLNKNTSALLVSEYPR